MESNDKPYFVWQGDPLTKLEYRRFRLAIIMDVLIEQALALSNYSEAKLVIDKIKHIPR